MGTPLGKVPHDPEVEKTDSAFAILLAGVVLLAVMAFIFAAAWALHGVNGILAVIISGGGLILAFFEIRRRL